MGGGWEKYLAGDFWPVEQRYIDPPHPVDLLLLAGTGLLTCTAYGHLKNMEKIQIQNFMKLRL